MERERERECENEREGGREGGKEGERERASRTAPFGVRTSGDEAFDINVCRHR